MGVPSKWKESVRVLEFMMEESFPKLSVFTHDASIPFPAKLLEVNFDLVILGPTFLWCRNHTILKEEISIEYNFLKDLECPKIAFPQDEYDGSEFLEEWLLTWNVDITYSVLWNHWDIIYPKYKLIGTLKKGFTSYIPANWFRKWENPKSHKLRKIDVSYRTNEYSRYRCSLRNLKCEIGNRFFREYLKFEERCKMNLDIAAKNCEIIPNTDWHKFLENSKSCLATPSGSSILDTRGQVKDNIRHFLKVKSNPPFEEIYEKFLTDFETGKKFTALSPRNIEAGLCKTTQIATNGEYSNIMSRDEDYIYLEEDCSNMEEILQFLRDDNYLETVAYSCRKKILDTKALRLDTLLGEIANFISFDPKTNYFRNENLINSFKEDRYKMYQKLEENE